jgi:hypothetical protein
MNRNRRGTDPGRELTDLEVGILIALKHKQSATADQVRRELPWAVDALSVRAALLRLEESARVVHVIHSGQIYYRSVTHQGRSNDNPACGEPFHTEEAAPL